MTPGIRRRSLVIVVFIVRPALVFCFVFILFLNVKYYKDSMPFMFLYHKLVVTILSTTRIGVECGFYFA
jgi:hypothetical protein